METGGSTTQVTQSAGDTAERIYWVLLGILQTVMLVELVVLVRSDQWPTDHGAVQGLGGLLIR